VSRTKHVEIKRIAPSEEAQCSNQEKLEEKDGTVNFYARGNRLGEKGLSGERDRVLKHAPGRKADQAEKISCEGWLTLV